jgi:hypothetical protein
MWSGLNEGCIIVRNVKWRGLRWAAHVARVGTQSMNIEIWWKNVSENHHLEIRGRGWKIILTLILGKQFVRIAGGLN